MIALSLIPESAWKDIPDPIDEAFLFLYEIANKNFRKRSAQVGKGGSPYTKQDWRRQYIWEMASVAAELGISGLPPANDAQTTSSAMDDFDAKMARLITKLKIANRAVYKANSVHLSQKTKVDIQKKIGELRKWLDQSNLTKDRKIDIGRKIDDVERELNETRSSMKAFWILAGAVSLHAISVLGDGPDAIKTTKALVEWVHGEKVAEEQRSIDLDGLPAIEYTPPPLLTDQTRTA